jgi:D-serine deaminase-like pyridoxal phosphate-dependent protein
MNWYEINNIKDFDSPALIVYPERVAQNISACIKMVGDLDRLRPHVKTNKTIEVVQMMLAQGIAKFKCATIAEAEMLALAGAADVLLAYQPTGPKILRLVELALNYPLVKFSCLADNIESVKSIAQIFDSKELQIEIYIDLNVGMNRTGILPGKEAIDLYAFASTLKGVMPVGLHAYDGHIRNQDINDRTEACNKAFEAVSKMQADMILAGIREPILIAGGTPSFPIHATKTDRECSPGTFVFWDHGYEVLCAEQPFQPAALVISRVISLPSESIICTDLGHKSVAAENDIARRVTFLNAPGLQPVGQSEEHLVLKTEPGHGFKVGDLLYGLPYHICPTVALYERAYTVGNGDITGEWKIVGRDRRISS